ncbi:MAG: inositol monophosphatase family protein [Bacteroidetes bacterium]|jgi:myo-inositol-1(or 4)-monophosphatase|nr:inositol monophosphatase family protein [Bacteroidota bacterium]
MQLENLTYRVCDLSRTTGQFIREQCGLFSEKKVEKKGRHDLVSYVDRTAEMMIINTLKKFLPEAGIIAEESGANIADQYNWIIDPLDGTTNFVHGVPVYAISIALKRDNELILGVVYEINQNECFYAWEGGPAYLNLEKITVSTADKLDNSLLATGFPYSDFSRMKPYLAFFEHLMQNSRGLRRLGSAAVDLAYVACGRFEAFYEYGLNPWDVAAGAFIVQQAGGKITRFDGNTEAVFGKDIIASNGKIHQEMLQMIQQFEGLIVK